MKLSALLDESLVQIHQGATRHRHRSLTALHLLLALLQEPTAAMLLHACGANADSLTDRLIDALDRMPATGSEAPQPDADVERALAHAAQQLAPNAGRSEVTGADVLVALLAGPHSQAVQWLADEGVTWMRAIALLEPAAAAVREPDQGEGVPQLAGSPQDLQGDVQRLRAELARDRAGYLEDYTIALSRWSAYLTETGADDALAATSEALDLALELERRADAGAARIVAGCCINRGTCLLQRRRFPEAVAMAEQAAGRFAAIADHGDVEGFRGLATALTLLSSARREAGAPIAALDAAKASTLAARRFNEHEPGIPAAWLLAACLANDGAARTETQDLEGAVSVLAEAASLYERMPRDEGGITVSKWVVCLIKLGACCGALGRPDDALVHARIAAELASELPEDEPALARARIAVFGDLAVRLHEAGESAEAVPVARQAHERARALARKHPHLLLDEAQSASNLGLILGEVGDMPASLQWCEEALALAERAERELDADLRALKARLIGNVGKVLGRLGRYAESLQVEDGGLRIVRSLVRDDASSHQPLLVGYLLNGAVARMRAGAFEEALRLLQEAHPLTVDLVGQNPQAHRLLLAHVNGALSLAHGHLDQRREALESARDATAALRELVGGHRHAYLHGLAVSLSNLGIAESHAGTSQAAVQATLEALALLRELEERGAPDDTAMLSCLNNLAGRWIEIGEDERGRQALRECGARLLRTPPTDPIRWTELAATVSVHLDAAEDLRSWHLPLLESLADMRELAHDDRIANAFVELQARAAACAWDRAVVLAADGAALAEEAATVLVSTLHSPDLARWLKARGGAGLDELAARKAEVLAADQALQALVPSSGELPSADPGRDARVAILKERVRQARAGFRECRSRLIAADPALRGAFDGERRSLRELAGHAGASAALFLLQIAGDADDPPRAVGVWIPAKDGPLRLLAFSALHDLCAQAARRAPLGGRLRRLRNSESSPTPDAGTPQPLDDIARALRTGFWQRLPASGPLHVCCHGVFQHLPLALCDDEGRASHWPGLPFLRLAADAAEPMRAEAWLVEHDCAWHGEQPLPMAALEAELARLLLAEHGRSVTSFAAGSGSTGPWAGLLACCHGQRRESHFDSSLELGAEPLDVRSLMGRRVVDCLALLPACHAGETRDDDAGNSLGIAAAFLLGGTRVVVASSKAVADDLMPWLTTLVLWHLVKGLAPHEAARRARAEFGALDFPIAYRKWLRLALPQALRPLQPGGGEHHPARRRPLDDLADAWPWSGDTLHLFSDDAVLRAAATRSVADGVLDPGVVHAERLRADARETAAFLMVYGVA